MEGYLKSLIGLSGAEYDLVMLSMAAEGVGGFALSPICLFISSGVVSSSISVKLELIELCLSIGTITAGASREDIMYGS